MDKEVQVYRLEAESMIRQVVQNLVEAGVITPDETQAAFTQLERMEAKDLVTCLCETHVWAEERARKRGCYFPVDMRYVGRN